MKQRWHPVQPVWVALVSLVGWPLGFAAGAINGYLLGGWRGVGRALSLGGLALVAELVAVVLVYGLLPDGPAWLEQHLVQLNFIGNLLVGCGIAAGQWRVYSEMRAKGRMA